ncbi:merozoite surface protein 1 paralog, putative [Plasmodium gallinaceum]|uniref:Merozoite surface protein 1 paralog, putative n=1 Tax=Plasmodium gallinaceum TaxID=5849 RepID=A0A1J1GZX5_PLAGA|nr:merozoite surface protein 1 paralog, putative [Plasmodium gallinaceum]CRG96850.1 merozoite surface protein 1 paralog, putative [Plasmodium gallinaceum]
MTIFCFFFFFFLHSQAKGFLNFLHKTNETTKKYTFMLISLIESREKVKLNKNNDKKLKEIEENIKKIKREMNNMYFSLKHLYSSINLSFTKELYLYDEDVKIRIFEEESLNNLKTINDLKVYLEKITRRYKKKFMKNKLEQTCNYINTKNILRKQIEVLRYSYHMILIKLYYKEYINYFRKLINNKNDFFNIPFNSFLYFKEDIFYKNYENYNENITEKDILNEEKEIKEKINKMKNEDGDQMKSEKNIEKKKKINESKSYLYILSEKSDKEFMMKMRILLNNIYISLGKNIFNSVKYIPLKMIEITEKQIGVNYCRDVYKELKYKNYDKTFFDENHFENLIKYSEEKTFSSLILEEKKNLYEKRGVFHYFIFFHIEKILIIKRKLENKLLEFIKLFKQFQNNPQSMIITIKNEIKYIFGLLNEYIDMYSFIYLNFDDYYNTIRDILSLNYIEKNLKDNRKYIAEKIIKHLSNLNRSFSKYSKTKEIYENFIENLTKKKDKTMKNKYNKNIKKNNEKKNDMDRNETLKKGEKNKNYVDFNNIKESENFNLKHPLFPLNDNENFFIEKEDREKKSELYNRVIKDENEYLHNLKNIMKLLNDYKKLKNKKIKIKYVSNINKTEREPILFASKFRQYQIIEYYKNILLFIKMLIIKRILLKLKTKIKFLKEFSPSAFLFNKYFFFIIYNSSFQNFIKKYKKKVNTDFCFNLTLINLESSLKYFDLFNILIDYMFYIFNLNPNFMSKHLSVDNELILTDLYENIKNLKNLTDIKNFLQTKFSQNIYNLSFKNIKKSFKFIHTYLHNIFNSDNISTHILKNFENLKIYQKNKDLHKVYNEIYSKNKIENFIFNNMNDLKNEFNYVNTTNVSSINFCSYIEFPLKLFDNTFLMNSLTESYKFILYKTQQNYIFKLYYYVNYKNTTIFEKIIFQLLSKYNMETYNNLKINMMKSYCKKKKIEKDKKFYKSINFFNENNYLNEDKESYNFSDSNNKYIYENLVISCSECLNDKNSSQISKGKIDFNSKRNMKIGKSQDKFENVNINNNLPCFYECDLLDETKKSLLSFHIKNFEKYSNKLELELPKENYEINNILHLFTKTDGNYFRKINKNEIKKELIYCNNIYINYKPFSFNSTFNISLANEDEFLLEKDSIEHYYFILNLLHEYLVNKNENLLNIKKVEKKITNLYVKIKLYEENISQIYKQTQLKNLIEDTSEMKKQYKNDISKAVYEKHIALLDIYRDIIQIYAKTENHLISLKKVKEKKKISMRNFELNKYSHLIQNQKEDIQQFNFYHNEILKYLRKQEKCCDSYIKEMLIHFKYLSAFHSSFSNIEKNKKIIVYIYRSIIDSFNDIIRCEKNTKDLIINYNKIKEKLRLMYTINSNSHKKYRKFYLLTNYFYIERDDNIYFFIDIYEKIRNYKIYEKLISDIKEDLFIVGKLNDKNKKWQLIFKQIEKQINILIGLKKKLHIDVVSNVKTLYSNLFYELMMIYEYLVNFEKNLNKKLLIYNNTLNNIENSFENKPNFTYNSFFYNYVKYDNKGIEFIDKILEIYEGKNYVNLEKENNYNSNIYISYNKNKMNKNYFTNKEGTPFRLVENECKYKICPPNSFCSIHKFKEKCFCFLNYTMIDNNCYLNKNNTCKIKNGGCDDKANCELKKNKIYCSCPLGTESLHEGVLCSLSMFEKFSNFFIFLLILISYFL